MRRRRRKKRGERKREERKICDYVESTGQVKEELGQEEERERRDM